MCIYAVCVVRALLNRYNRGQKLACFICSAYAEITYLFTTSTCYFRHLVPGETSTYNFGVLFSVSFKLWG